MEPLQKPTEHGKGHRVVAGRGAVRVSTASDGEGMARFLAESIVDLIVLDLRLGKEDGLGLLRELRGHSDVPIIILTGQRLDEVDRMVGLELGADDYIAKPFSPREVLARIRAVLRRVQAHEITAVKGTSPPDTVSAAGSSTSGPAD